MKRSILLLLSCILYCINTNTYSQISNNELDSGEGVILSSKTSESEEFLYQTFEIEVPESGEYYLSAWVKGALTPDGEKLEYSFKVNDDEVEQKIKAENSRSHPLSFNDKKFDFNTGVNTVTIKTRIPDYPNVEFIKVSLDKEKSKISSELYESYLVDLSDNVLPDNYEEIMNLASEELSGNSVKKESFRYDSKMNYECSSDISVRYTEYMSIYLYSGNTYTFETKNANTDPVIQLFYQWNPIDSAWYDDNSGSGYNAKLVFNCHQTGSYRLVIHQASYCFATGLCNLYKNNSLYKLNCAVSGDFEYSYLSSSDTNIRNWFTADPSTYTSIWIYNQPTGGPHSTIRSYSHYWLESSDFNWRLNARIRDTLKATILPIMTSATYSSHPFGTCDLYAKCLDSDLHTYDDYPDLKALDAIQSAPWDPSYNCIAWAGGITDDDVWPLDPDSDYCYDPDNDDVCDSLASFDSFFSDANRYSGAMTFTRTGANSSNSVIDLWFNPNAGGSGVGEYTHASIRKPGNDHPHGYDWESKPGPLMRTFHPRDALENTGLYAYGYVDVYYTPSSKKSSILLDESIARGLSVREYVDMTEEEIEIINNSISTLSEKEFNLLNEKYNEWKETWKDPKIMKHSNPKMYASSEEYYNFKDYCKFIGKRSWPFIFDRFLNGDYYTKNIFFDLIYPEYPEILDN